MPDAHPAQDAGSATGADGEVVASPGAGDEGYRRLFESHPAAMAIWDPATGRILAANEAAVRQYGYDPEDLAELTIDQIVHPEDLPRLREELADLPEGLAGSAPFRHVRRNGEVIEVEMSGHPLEWNDRPARLVMAIDVTARRRLEQELRSARAIEAVGRLAGGIAHDFNNLVMAINGFAELLLERLPEASEEHDAAAEIRTAGLRAAALTSQLLAFARPHEPRLTRFDLNELVTGLDGTLRSVSGPNVRVVIELSATNAMVVADRDQMAQAIVGCVLNAREAMPDGGDLRIETTDVDAGDARQLTGAVDDMAYIGLAVTDSGPTGGRVADRPISNRTGLGLALIYSTIQLARGRIRLESTPGRGSTIRILLPVDADAGDQPGVLEAEPSGPDQPAISGPIDMPQAEDVSPPGSGGIGILAGLDAPIDCGPAEGGATLGRPDAASVLIVVVEDEPGVRTFVERVLARAGHRVLAFPDGATALEALVDSETPIDLLVTDLVMPGPNGIEVARRFRRDRPNLPVLLMSGYAADALDAEGITEGTIEILDKPFAGSELLDRVAAVLRPGSAGA